MKIKNILLSIVLVSVIFAGPGFTQEDIKKEGSGALKEKVTVTRDNAIALSRDLVKLERMKVVAQNIQLSAKEAETFWQEYGRYQDRLEPLRDRMVKLIVSYGQKFDTMTDNDAKAMLEEMLSVQEDEAKVRREALPRFEAILPVKKVVRFYQIENKMNAEIRYAMSLEIPLLETEEISSK